MSKAKSGSFGKPAFRAYYHEPLGAWKDEIEKTGWTRSVDIALVIGLIASILICVVKGVGVIAGWTGVQLEMTKHEAAILFHDPAPFSGIQMLIYLFYLVPVQCISLYYTFKSIKPRFLWDITLVHAGIMIQSQPSHIYIALDPQMPEDFRSKLDDELFWIVNLVIVVVPHLFLYRLYLHRQSTPHSPLEKKID